MLTVRSVWVGSTTTRLLYQLLVPQRPHGVDGRGTSRGEQRCADAGGEEDGGDVQVKAVRSAGAMPKRTLPTARGGG